MQRFFLLFLSPFLESFLFSDRGGFSFRVLEREVEIWPMHEVVLLHVHSLCVGGLLPFLSDSPAWAWAAEPDPVFVFFGGQGCFGCCQTLLLFLRSRNAGVVCGWSHQILPGQFVGCGVPVFFLVLLLFLLCCCRCCCCRFRCLFFLYVTVPLLYCRVGGRFGSVWGSSPGSPTWSSRARQSRSPPAPPLDPALAAWAAL